MKKMITLFSVRQWRSPWWDAAATMAAAIMAEAGDGSTLFLHQCGGGSEDGLWSVFRGSKFPIGGGDSEHMTTDAPGAFDVSKTEELTSH